MSNEKQTVLPNSYGDFYKHITRIPMKQSVWKIEFAFPGSNVETISSTKIKCLHGENLKKSLVQNWRTKDPSD